MKPIHYLGLAVRLFAICLIAFAVYNLAGLISSYFSASEFGPYSVISLPLLLVAVVLPMLISILLWFFPLSVAYKLLGSEDREFEPINPKSLLTILIASIGLFFLYKALMDGVFWLSFYFGYSTGGSYMETPMEVPFFTAIGASGKATIISTIIELVFALILTLRCKSIAKLMARIAR